MRRRTGTAIGILVWSAALTATAFADSIPSVPARRPALRLGASPGLYGTAPHSLGFLSISSVPDSTSETSGPSGTPALSLTSRSVPNRFLFVKERELSRFECALKGAGAATTFGWCLAVLADQTNVMDSKTAWYMAGACAAMGAALGGTVGAENPAWRISAEWDP